MRRLIPSTLAIAIALSLTPLAIAGDGWLTNYKEAQAQAKAAGKPILADFTGSDWCGWCIKLKKEVFSTEAFKTWAAKNVILLELDFPRRTAQDAQIKAQNQGLQRKYGIRGFPTVLFLDHAGKVLGKTGYVRGGPQAWIQNAEMLMSPDIPDPKTGKTASGWHTSYKAALAEAKQSNKPIMVDFTGSDWCGWCIKLKKEVFSTEAFKTWAAKKVVLLELDFPRRTQQDALTKGQNKKLLSKYGVRGFPTILFLDLEGNVLGKSGYKAGGPAGWCQNADAIVAKMPAAKDDEAGAKK